jgi:hypothetical protein
MTSEAPTPAHANSPVQPNSQDAHSINPAQPLLHRVCIQCNNMFCVTPDHYDAKQCPNCHKG